MENVSTGADLILIDTDCGTDDAMAIWMAIHAQKLGKCKIVGIICGHGNCKVEDAVRNVARVLKAVGEYGKIPIYKGAQTSIVEPFVHKMEPFHGDNGFGDVEDELEEIQVNFEAEHGVSALIRLAHEHERKISILALGPLTNLAIAIRIDPTVGRCFKIICAMGGNMEGEGNATVAAEFNFAVDPEAAYITLHSYETIFPIRIVPWEVCRKTTLTTKWRKEQLGIIDSPQMGLLNKVEQKILEKHAEFWIPCDQLAAASLIFPEMITDFKTIPCTVELQGLHTRGMMVLDPWNLSTKNVNVEIVIALDMIQVTNLMTAAVSSFCELKPLPDGSTI